MDVLSDVLRVVRLSGAVFFTADFSAPWALESPNPDLLASIVIPEAECVALFHILVDGECVIECGAHPAVHMGAGDAIVFPHGEPHTMRSLDCAAPIPMRAVFSGGSTDELPRVSFGGGGRTSRFICGYLNCDQRFAPLVGSLPTMLVIRSRGTCTTIEAIGGEGRPSSAAAPEGAGSWLGTTLQITIHEARTGRPGNSAMLGRLTELMFVGVLREYMQQQSAGRGSWLAGLNDARVGKALRLLHAQPTRDWTVETLAREVAVSRSALAQRFTALVGEAPMRYLARWRIQLAKQLLREGGHSIREVASRVGYESEAAFNRAFKRVTGAPPAAWRRTALKASVVAMLLTDLWPAVRVVLPGLMAEAAAGLALLVS